MQNLWNEAEAARHERDAGPDPADRALALRVYSSRLIGAEPALVMHGGGNTSAKVIRRDRFGRERRVLHVKGSGWDLGTIQAAGLPGVWLDPLLEARALDELSDEEMVALQRTNLLDPAAPNPSVETLLHAFLPHEVIDHTHATAMLAIANLEDVAEVAAELYGDRVALVPYIMPGFALAKAACAIAEEAGDIEGLLLVNHGHFTIGPDARTAYARMIDHVSRAEAYLARRGARSWPAAIRPGRPWSKLSELRSALAPAAGSLPILDVRSSEGVLEFLARADVRSLATRGVATPDHVIRTKRFPLVLAADDTESTIRDAISAYRSAYAAAFEAQVARVGPRIMLDPSPRVVWVPGVGVIGVGDTAGSAAAAADLAEQTLAVIDAAEAAGGFRPVGTEDTFDMEYWSLEQAKLGKAGPKPLAGRVVLVTGGAGAIGRAVATAFRAEGAELMLADLDGAALEAASRTVPGAATWVGDLTVPDAGRACVEACAARFGGVDVCVLNAGAAWTGAIATMPDEVLERSFALNFWAHQRVASAAVAVMRRQGRGGHLLFNISKQAVNPGPGFGAYGVPKAALFALMRQYAVELGGEGIRANGVNADRIRSGLLTGEMIAQRAHARGVSEGDYMAGNLLHREVTAADVARAFVALDRSVATTGHVFTVDGGNVAAALR